MQSKIIIKRGLSSNLQSLTLDAGEPAFTLDSGKLYIGNGTTNVLMNDDLYKPQGLDTNNAYTKAKVNEFGQVIAQSNLEVADVPSIPTSKISDLGSLATVNIGNLAGQIPVLNQSGKFPSNTVPSFIPETLYAYYVGPTISSEANTNIILNTQSITGTGALSLDLINSIINVNQTGTYMISFSISSDTKYLLVALTDELYQYRGAVTKSTTDATPSFVNGSASVIQTINPGEKIILRNIGQKLTIGSNCASVSVVKLS